MPGRTDDESGHCGRSAPERQSGGNPAANPTPAWGKAQSGANARGPTLPRGRPTRARAPNARAADIAARATNARAAQQQFPDSPTRARATNARAAQQQFPTAQHMPRSPTLPRGRPTRALPNDMPLGRTPTCGQSAAPARAVASKRAGAWRRTEQETAPTRAKGRASVASGGRGVEPRGGAASNRAGAWHRRESAHTGRQTARRGGDAWRPRRAPRRARRMRRVDQTFSTIFTPTPLTNFALPLHRTGARKKWRPGSSPVAS